MDGSATIGIVNTLRTGNILIDAVISSLLCVLLPLLLSNANVHIHRIGFKIKKFWNSIFSGPEPDEYIRSIEFEELRSCWGYLLNAQDEKNNILQKAITLQIARDDHAYRDCDLSLTAVKEVSKNDRDENSDDSDEEDLQDGEDIYGNTTAELRTYKITKMPPLDEWVDIGGGIEFRQTRGNKKDDEENEGGGEKKSSDSENKFSKKRVLFELKSSGEGGADRVEAYIKKAYEEYVNEIERNNDRGLVRHLYIPKVGGGAVSSGDGDNKQEKGPGYKRYKLADSKTFKSLFFPGKDPIIKVLNDFQEKQGKYAIEGYPHKLGLLLYGPPGTGKTSLIKALAHHTNRSIVSIPLTRIKTNQQLMDVVMDQKFPVEGEDVDIKLSFKHVIFVMEDIDCCSKIVHRRDGGNTHRRQRKTSKSTIRNTEHDSTVGSSLASDSDSDEEIIQGPVNAPSSSDGKSTGKEKFKWGSTSLKIPDKLDLSGILNVLDGVVDTPGRMLIMTTNHPEKLDPALIRPGRIDKKVKLSYMDVENAILLIQHYFQTTIPKDMVLRFQNAWAEGQDNVTPAQVEQLCAEYDDLEEFSEVFCREVRNGFATSQVQPDW